MGTPRESDTSSLGTSHPLGPAYPEPRSAPPPQAVDQPLDLVCLGACCSMVRESLQLSRVCLREPPPRKYSHLGHRAEARALGFQPLPSHLQSQQGSNDGKQSSFPRELLYRALVTQRPSTHPLSPNCGIWDHQEHKLWSSLFFTWLSFFLCHLRGPQMKGGDHGRPVPEAWHSMSFKARFSCCIHS